MPQGFDNRIVSYERIHSIKQEDFDALLEAVDPKPGQIILDAMCGYGAVAKGLIQKEPSIQIYLCDESEVQLERAKANLPELPDSCFPLQSFPGSSFAPDFFDAIVIKMGLHEVPKDKQGMVVQEIYKLLKPDGKFVVWDIMLNQETQALFQDIIRKKDELAGFDMLVRERYFFREEEFLNLIKAANFTSIHDFHTIHYRFSSKKRLESELHNDSNRLDQLNGYIRTRFPEELKTKMNYEDRGDDIQFDIVKKIYLMAK